MSTTRIAVIGLGTTGSMTAWQLSLLPGVEVIGFEQAGFAHSYGAFGGAARLFRTAYHEGEQYVPLLVRARELWEELGDATGRDLLQPCGSLTIGPAHSPGFQRMLESIDAYDLPHEALTAGELRRRVPGTTVRDDDAGVLDLLGGAMLPQAAVVSAVDLARAHGARIHENERILAIRDDGDGVVISTTERVETVDRVVVSAGVWIRELVPEVAALVQVRRLAFAWFLPRLVASSASGVLPGLIRQSGELQVFGTPAPGGYSVRVTGTGVEEGDDLGEISTRVAELFPGVRPEPERCSVHHDTVTSTGDPIVDVVGNIVVVTGLSGHGIKMAPALGEVAASLAARDEAEYYLPDFAATAHDPLRMPA